MKFILAGTLLGSMLFGVWVLCRAAANREKGFPS